jgi:hypothetical protein
VMTHFGRVTAVVMGSQWESPTVSRYSSFDVCDIFLSLSLLRPFGTDSGAPLGWLFGFLHFISIAQTTISSINPC